MRSSEIRKKFLEFFKAKGHTVVASDLLVPVGDPTVLFTGAGMNQFKEQFMARNITYRRAASCQKCLRTGDLENVGRTPRHHTFFEMLGNFSFGDYFKKEAIFYAWQFMTEEMALPEKKLWVSIYEEDEESYGIWLNDIGVPREKIIRLGAHDNFWPADAPTKGPNGPCGPCSEIFYDWGEDAGCGKKTCGPACDCGRFVEVWNLVFTEFERKPDASLTSLPNKNIDTGMGLERIASVMQGVRTNFQTDLFTGIIAKIRRELGDAGKKPEEEDLNLIADHIRAAAFAIADGVSPSNEKRGYVVRKLIRRAYLRASREGAFLHKIVPAVTDAMKDAYPELEEKREHISAIVEEEEKRFAGTLESSMPVLEDMLKKRPGRLTGEEIFKLVDTYGLPLDVIEEETDAVLDIKGFEKLMEERKEESRRGSDITEDFIFEPDKFAGLVKPENSDTLPLETKVEFILLGSDVSSKVEKGERAEIVTSPQSSRFYAEGGGQAGDKGTIEKEGCDIKVLDTFETGGRKVLVVFVKKGSLAKGDKIKLHLDTETKKKTALNHTATHLVQAALRSVLGDEVKQSGSLVDDKRLRFDFTHMKKLSERELAKVENAVNAWIAEGIEVCKEVKRIDEARAEGALSFFGEKYGSTVRVVSVGDKSKELCGGTHVDNTREIGVLKVTAESSVASGIRRIEALTGDNAREWIRDKVRGFLAEHKELTRGAESLVDKAVIKRAEDIAGGAAVVDADAVRDFREKLQPAFTEERMRLEREKKKRKKQEEASSFNEAKEKLDKAYASSLKIGEVSFIPCLIEGMDIPLLRKALAYLERKTDSAVILLGSSKDEKAYLVCSVTEDLLDKGMNAQKIISGIAREIKGSGGGKATFAQAGGAHPAGLGKAIREAKSIIEKRG